MYGALVLNLAAIAVAAYLALKTERGGWVGIPLGSAVSLATLFLWIDMPSIMEFPGFIVGACVSGIAAIGLPKNDTILAVAVGTIISCIFFFQLLPTHDSPLVYIAAIPSAGFVLGSMLSLARRAFFVRTQGAKPIS